MDTCEPKVHSFIVKIWFEEVGDETEGLVWHGYLTHVPSGERYYLKELSDIEDFIERCLGNLKDKPRHDSSLRRVIRRLRFWQD